MKRSQTFFEIQSGNKNLNANFDTDAVVTAISQLVHRIPTQQLKLNEQFLPQKDLKLVSSYLEDKNVSSLGPVGNKNCKKY